MGINSFLRWYGFLYEMCLQILCWIESEEGKIFFQSFDFLSVLGQFSSFFGHIPIYLHNLLIPLTFDISLQVCPLLKVLTISVWKCHYSPCIDQSEAPLLLKFSHIPLCKVPCSPQGTCTPI